MEPIKAYIDGSCNPNPGGTAYVGVYIPKQKGISEEIKYQGLVGRGEEISSNLAEYMAGVVALKFLDDFKNDRDILLYTDSQLVAMQISGRWGVSKGAYIPAYNMLVNLIKDFKHVEISWIPREKNTIADAISKGLYNGGRNSAKYLLNKIEESQNNLTITDLKQILNQVELYIHNKIKLNIESKPKTLFQEVLDLK